MKALRTVVLMLVVCGLALTAGCGARAAGNAAGVHATGVGGVNPGGPVVSGVVTAVVLAVPAKLGPFSPRTIWIVGLDGRVTTRVIHPEAGSVPALSPDGRTLLYESGPASGPTLRVPTGLHALDLDSGREATILSGPSVMSYGWDSTGRVVALGGGVADAATKGLTVWHGLPGSLASAGTQATMPVDASALVASDGRTAYFIGSTRLTNSMESPSVDHLWRYDFASHRMALVMSMEQPGMATNAPTRSLLYPPYDGAPPYSWNLPSIGLPISTTAPTSGGPRPYRIDLLRYSDLSLERSIIPTPPGAAEYDPGPVFDAAFSRYIARTTGDFAGMPLPSKIVEVDVATGRASIVAWPADSLVHPIGYLGSTASFLFMSRDPKGVAVVLQEPGAKPRVIVRVSGPYSTQVTWPGILGVQYAK